MANKPYWRVLDLVKPLQAVDVVLRLLAHAGRQTTHDEPNLSTRGSRSYAVFTDNGDYLDLLPSAKTMKDCLLQ